MPGRCFDGNQRVQEAFGSRRRRSGLRQILAVLEAMPVCSSRPRPRVCVCGSAAPVALKRGSRSAPLGGARTFAAIADLAGAALAGTDIATPANSVDIVSVLRHHRWPHERKCRSVRHPAIDRKSERGAKYRARHVAAAVNHIGRRHCTTTPTLMKLAAPCHAKWCLRAGHAIDRDRKRPPVAGHAISWVRDEPTPAAGSLIYRAGWRGSGPEVKVVHAEHLAGYINAVIKQIRPARLSRCDGAAIAIMVAHTSTSLAPAARASGLSLAKADLANPSPGRARAASTAMRLTSAVRLARSVPVGTKPAPGSLRLIGNCRADV